MRKDICYGKLENAEGVQDSDVLRFVDNIHKDADSKFRIMRRTK